MSNKDERYRWIQHKLVKYRYLTLGKHEKGVVIRFLGKVTGYSRQQLTRLIRQYRERGRLVRQQRTTNGFRRRYQAADVVLLARLDERHDTLNGATTKKLCERAFEVYGNQAYSSFLCR
jgi:transposase